MTYTVTLTYSYRVTANPTIEVDADSAEQAEEIILREMHAFHAYRDDFDICDVSVVEVQP